MTVMNCRVRMLDLNEGHKMSGHRLFLLLYKIIRQALAKKTAAINSQNSAIVIQEHIEKPEFTCNVTQYFLNTVYDNSHHSVFIQDQYSSLIESTFNFTTTTVFCLSPVASHTIPAILYAVQFLKCN